MIILHLLGGLLGSLWSVSQPAICIIYCNMLDMHPNASLMQPNAIPMQPNADPMQPKSIPLQPNIPSVQQYATPIEPTASPCGANYNPDGTNSSHHATKCDPYATKCGPQRGGAGGRGEAFRSGASSMMMAAVWNPCQNPPKSSLTRLQWPAPRRRPDSP